MKKEKLILLLSILILIVAAWLYMNSQNVLQKQNANQESISNVPTDTVLNLSGQGLSAVPSYVFNMSNLQELDVSHNDLSGALPSQLGKLSKLKILVASDNRMTGVPAEIGQLSQLEVLDLSNNQLTGLPDELGNLKNLKTFNLSGNSYSTTDLDQIRAKLPNTNFIQNSQSGTNPAATPSISQSNILDLSNRGLTTLALSIFDSTNLQQLDLSHNKLTGALPSQVGQLRNLKILDASYNDMTGVPAEIGQLSQLEVLDLSYNKITGLPNELGNLKNLKTFDLAGNNYSAADLSQLRSKLPNTNFIIN